MRPRTLVFALGLALAVAVAPAEAQRHHRGHYPRVHVGWGMGLAWGPGWWWGPGPYRAYEGRGAVSDLTVVDTDVEPEHARVTLDGTLIGTADDFDGYPDYLYLEPGHYTLEISLPGYRSEKVEIDARAGKYVPIDMTLKHEPGKAEAPWWDRPEDLPTARVFGPATGAGDHRIVARPDPGLRPELRQRDDDDEEEEEEEGAAATEPSPPARSARGAAVEIRATPANASVYLDGEFLGTAAELTHLTRGVAVPPGHHTLEVMAPGKSPKRLDFEVEQGRRQQLVVDLE